MISAGLKSMFGRGGENPARPDSPAAAEGSAPASAVTADAAAAEPTSTASSVIEPAPAAPKADGEKRAAKLVEVGTRDPLGRARDALSGAVLAAKARPALPAAAAASLAALAVGYGLGLSGQRSAAAADASRWQDAQIEARQAREDTSRLAQDLRVVRTALDALKSERDKVRGELTAKQALLGDKLERLGQDTGAKVARLGEQVERLGRDLARAKENGDKVAAAPAASAPTPTPTPPAKPVAAAGTPADVTQTGSIPEARKAEIDPRRNRLDGFFVRDYDDGFALIELRSGGYMDAAVGYVVPGAGKVEAIERRGRQWVVVTTKGFIAER